MRLPILVASLLFSICISAQKLERRIQFKFTFDKQSIELGKQYYAGSIDDSIKIETVKLYISNVQFFKGPQWIFDLDKKHLLLDIDNPESLRIDLAAAPNLNFDKIRFNIGIDSLTNVSGAFGGALDPTNGMYWTWQSGYINFKLEGVSAVCPSRKNQFQFHIGGYQYPYNTLQKIELNTSGKKDIVIAVALDTILSEIDLGKTYQIMSPNQQAVAFAKVVAAEFSISK